MLGWFGPRMATPLPAGFALDGPALHRRIDELAAVSEAPAPVVTRVLFSDADLAARRLVVGWCREAGFTTRTDAAGNIFARWEGADPALPPVATGSHIDAIPNAGRYDGVVGVLGGLAAMEALQRSGLRPRRAVELIVFTAEEPTRFGLGCLGSRIMGGALDPAAADRLADGEGKTFAQWRSEAGFDGDLAGVRLEPGHYAAFVELHIEQGPVLEREGLDVAVVERIAAPAALRVRLTGEGGHAGAVLMPERHDALLAGAEIALAVEAAAKTSASPDAVGTTGVFRVGPGAINSVPAWAELEIDLRDTDLQSRETMRASVERAVAEVSGRRGITFEINTINADPPAVCDAGLIEKICAQIEEIRRSRRGRCSSRKLVSRAYHDTLFMARVCPATMIFIPCRGGVSHRPDEYASPEAIETGATVLAAALAELAKTA